MALIKCTACGASVSSQAAACPRCGHPVGSSGINVPLATVQLTSKRLKSQMIISVLLILTAITIILILRIGKINNPRLTAAAILAGVIGIPWYFITRIRIWWHHK